MHFVRYALLALSSLVVTLASLEARQEPEPEPRTPGLGKLAKYFFDDTESVMAINVKRLVASQLYRKQLQKPVEKFLATPIMAGFFKPIGVSPIRDIDQIVIVMGRSTWVAPDGGRDMGPIVLFHGRFDEKKMHAGLEKLVEGVGKKLEGRGVRRSTK